MLRTFVFDLRVMSKPFSEKLPATIIEFKSSRRLILTFPENGFNFLTQKFAKKNLKNALFKCSEQSYLNAR